MAKKLSFYCVTLLFSSCFLCISVHAQNHYHYQYEVVKMDSTFDKEVDLTVETYIKYLKQDKDKKMGQIIGSSKEVLTSFAPMSPLSNLLVDIIFEWGNTYLSSKKSEQADMALLNFGGIRAALPQGKITVGDIYQIAPFDNTVAFVYAKGSELKKMFGVFTEKRNAPMANVQTTYRNGRLSAYTIANAPLDNDKVYIIVTLNFLAKGGDNLLNSVISENVIYTNTPVRDVFIDWIRKKTVENIEIEGVTDDRVIILSTP